MHDRDVPLSTQPVSFATLGYELRDCCASAERKRTCVGCHRNQHPQFVARDFKEFIRIAGMTHVKTSPYYPQSNGKIKRYHRTIKGECIRVTMLWSLDDARRTVDEYVSHYNEVRLHSAIGYVTPQTKLEGREKQVFAERDRKLEAAREQRRIKRMQARQAIA